MVAPSLNPDTQEVEAGGLEVEGDPQALPQRGKGLIFLLVV